jgi:hypothetical protein
MSISDWTVTFDNRALLTVAAFIFVFFVFVAWAMSYSQQQFARQLKARVNKDVKNLTEKVERDLQISLGSEHLPEDGIGS